MSLLPIASETLARFGVHPGRAANGLPCRTPITGETLGYLAPASDSTVEAAIASASEAFALWRDVPAPRRGELVRLLGEALRAVKDDLATLVTLEAGKIPAIVTHRFAMTDSVKAMNTLLSRKTVGKIVLENHF